MAAKVACENLKVQSQNDKDKLQKAKEEVYLKGFYEGVCKNLFGVCSIFNVLCCKVLKVGEYAERKIQEVKKPIKDKMISANEACVYYEPEKIIMSRSNDECVVALCDQWYVLVVHFLRYKYNKF